MTTAAIFLGASEEAIKLTDKLIIDIVMCSATDSVKLAALELLKHKFSSPTYNTISNCNFEMSTEDKE